MRQGVLVPDEVVIKMILERLEDEDCRQGMVLDGFPRTLEQAVALDEALEGKAIDRVLHMVVQAGELTRRLGGRVVCRGCQTPYRQETAPERCTGCGGELYQREDDREEAVRKRIQVYETQTAPLVDYYCRQGKLADVDGERTEEEVGREVLGLVERVASGPPCKESGIRLE
jgi:adenylate kinase